MKKNIWSGESKYGTYTGERGSPNQWKSNFDFAAKSKINISSSYSTLEITPQSTDAEIQKAYHKLAKKYHTDKQNGNAVKFNDVTQAYQTIKKSRHQNPISPIIPLSSNSQSSTIDFIPQLLTEIEESEIEGLILDDNICCQEKKDGRHITLQIKNGQFFVRNKQGKSSTFASEFESELRQLGTDLLIDGEQIENNFFVWDLIELGNKDLRDSPYLSRYNELSKLNFKTIKIVEIIIGQKNKRDFFERMKREGKEGVVFKSLIASFTSGKGNDQFKFKFYHECSVIVVPGRVGKASIGMELITPNGTREFVGYCSCNKNPPIGSIAEIKYLYAYRDGCLIQPSFKELRDDVNTNECLISQLKYKS